MAKKYFLPQKLLLLGWFFRWKQQLFFMEKTVFFHQWAKTCQPWARLWVLKCLSIGTPRDVFVLKLVYVSVYHLQSDISELERTRESMARELVSVCIHNEDLTGKLSHHEALQQKYAVSFRLLFVFVLSGCIEKDCPTCKKKFTPPIPKSFSYGKLCDHDQNLWIFHDWLLFLVIFSSVTNHSLA